MTKIEQLERELIKKNQALDDMLIAHNLLKETLERTIKSMTNVENQLNTIAIYLKDSRDTICCLRQENKNLKRSSKQWVLRAIQLEFKALSAADSIKNKS